MPKQLFAELPHRPRHHRGHSFSTLMLYLCINGGTISRNPCVHYAFTSPLDSRDSGFGKIRKLVAPFNDEHLFTVSSAESQWPHTALRGRFMPRRKPLFSGLERHSTFRQTLHPTAHAATKRPQALPATAARMNADERSARDPSGRTRAPHSREISTQINARKFAVANIYEDPTGAKAVPTFQSQSFNFPDRGTIALINEIVEEMGSTPEPRAIAVTGKPFGVTVPPDYARL